MIDKNKVKKLSRLLLVLLVVNLISGVTVYQSLIVISQRNNIQDLTNIKNNALNDLEEATSTIENLDHIDRLNEKYDNLIKDVVRSVSSRDKEYGIGGLDASSPSYTNKEALEAILSEVEARNPNEWFQNVGKFFSDREEYFSDVPDIWPIMRKDLGRITSGFGVRMSPITGRYHSHNGVDIAAEFGIPVIATADGEVNGVWNMHPTFGKIVYLEHDNKFETRYAHLSRITIKYRQKIKKGDIIGYVGSSGKSQGAHLHYEIRKNDQPMDPVKFWLLYY